MKSRCKGGVKRTRKGRELVTEEGNLTAARFGLEARRLDAGDGAGFVVFAPVARYADGADDAAGVGVEDQHAAGHRYHLDLP